MSARTELRSRCLQAYSHVTKPKAKTTSRTHVFSPVFEATGTSLMLNDANKNSPFSIFVFAFAFVRCEGALLAACGRTVPVSTTGQVLTCHARETGLVGAGGSCTSAAVPRAVSLVTSRTRPTPAEQARTFKGEIIFEIFTARIRRMMQGNVFSLFPPGGRGGTPVRFPVSSPDSGPRSFLEVPKSLVPFPFGEVPPWPGLGYPL